MASYSARMLFILMIAVCLGDAQDSYSQDGPYDVVPAAEPPYYRVRYPASSNPGELIYAVKYTVWIPPEVETLHGVIVHQHGCGVGSCRSGLTGAYDLHWQALAREHKCALLAPSYEQPDGADCQKWCDPRNGSGETFVRALKDLGRTAGHPELAEVPWALWGHSGGGHWAGGMVMLYPERVAAAWLRSGVPLLEPNPDRPSIQPHELPKSALDVPIMCNLGTKEGVTVTDGRFAKVWPANQRFFYKVRGSGGLIAVAVDPLTAHECGNQRYLAIPWLDACLRARLAPNAEHGLKAMPAETHWLAEPLQTQAYPAEEFEGDPLKAAWLPNEKVAKAWMQYVRDTKVSDETAPPSPQNLQLQGNLLTWECEADLESGLAYFIIQRDGKVLAKLPAEGKNRFGRPIFQGLQYSDTPLQPLIQMQFTDNDAALGQKAKYRIIAVNTIGLQSKASPPVAQKAER